MPRRYSQPVLDRPRLIPHAGLPGLDGTRRFAYSMEAAGAARDAFKLLPLLPSPLSTAAASSSPSDVVAVAAGGPGALGGGEAAVGGASAVAGGTSGVLGKAKGWSPTTGGYTAPATGGGETQ